MRIGVDFLADRVGPPQPPTGLLFTVLLSFSYMSNDLRVATGIAGITAALALFIAFGAGLILILRWHHRRLRIVLWKRYFQTILMKGDSAWFAGLGWSGLPEKNIYAEHFFSYGSTGIVENTFIFILISGGILALGLFLLLVLQLICRAVWLAKNGHTPYLGDFGVWWLAMLAAWLAMSLTGEVVTYVGINWYFYVFFGCVLAL